MKCKKPFSVQKKSLVSFHVQVRPSSKPASVPKASLTFKTNANAFSFLEDEQIDVKTLNFMIDKLWAKFIVFYSYEEVFRIPERFKRDESVMDMKKNIAEDFELKLKTYFEIYKVKKDENFNLMSLSNEGSYLLTDSKVWIMHMKVLMDKYSYKLKELFPMFSRAIENECDAKLLFDFFISALFKSENLEEEIESLTGDANLPKEIGVLWLQNKDYVMKVIDSEEVKKEKSEKKQGNASSDEEAEDEEESDKDDETSKEPNDFNEDDSKKIMEVSNEQEESPKPDMKKEAVTPQPNPNKKKEFHRAFNLDTDLKDAKVIDDNIRSSGNYAFIELNTKIQETVGQKYVLTPIKSTINKKEAYDDRKFINNKYQDYIYQPYTDQVANLIKTATKLKEKPTPISKTLDNSQQQP